MDENFIISINKYKCRVDPFYIYYAQMKCAYCAKARATHVCGQCKVMPYCSLICAKSDWAHHSKREHSTWHSDAMSLILSGTANLWVGGIESLQHLSEHNIGAVVTILQKDRVLEDAISEFVGTRPHLRFYMFDSQDEPIEKFFESSAKFIDRHIRAGRNVLVHCYAGISRSVTLCINYMTKKRGFANARIALDHIRRVRPYANPNPGFIKALEL